MEAEDWNKRWEMQEIGWDIGYGSPAILAYMQTYKNQDASILIPGCGNAYEATALVEAGFTNITVLDIAPKAVEILTEKFKGVPAITVLCGDFFALQGVYDLILEQAFFCAISPELRKDYVAKAFMLLAPSGKIVGLLFDKEFDGTGPPYGGRKVDYEAFFSPFFHIKHMEPCYNSIEQRKNAELFIELDKRAGIL
jgi:SAM-dependent methyltransferase